MRLTRATLLCIATAMFAQAIWAEKQRVEEPARQTTEEVATNR